MLRLFPFKQVSASWTHFHSEESDQAACIDMRIQLTHDVASWPCSSDFCLPFRIHPLLRSVALLPPTPVFLPGESQGWGAWWAAIYGVAQSLTRLKRLSNSSSRSRLASLTSTFFPVSNSSSNQGFLSCRG